MENPKVLEIQSRLDSNYLIEGKDENDALDQAIEDIKYLFKLLDGLLNGE